MKKWIETIHYRIAYGWMMDLGNSGTELDDKSGTIIINTNYDRLDNALAELDAFINTHQCKIMGVTPVTDSYCRWRSDWQYKSGISGSGGWGWGYGYGYGYAASQITGFVVLLQHEEDVTDEEFDRRAKLVELKQIKIPRLEKELRRLQGLVEADNDHPGEVIEKKGLLGGVKYIVYNEKFKTREEADSYLRNIKENASSNRASLSAIEHAVKEAREELERLKHNEVKQGM